MAAIRILLRVESTSSRIAAAPALAAAFPHALRSPELHPQEKRVLWLTGSALVFLPWALGGMVIWAQAVGLLLALCACVIALRPRHYAEELTQGAAFRLVMWPKLVRFPVFWLGVVYLAFVAIQAWNPAWRFMNSGKGWWVEPVDYISWLPHGVADTPLLKMNAWRALMVHAMPWLLACALWVGITRRKSVRILLWTVALNGAAIAVCGLLQRLTQSDEMFWFWRPPYDYFFGSFIYKNHAGAFLNLAIATSAGLGWWYSERAGRRMEKSHPGFVFLFLAAIGIVALLFTYARAAGALGLSFVAILGTGYGTRLAFRSRGGTPPLVTTLTAMFCAAFLGFAVYALNVERVIEKFGRLWRQDQTVSIERRQLAARAAIDMGQEHAWVGNGVGEFRYLFPRYQHQYPEIFSPDGKRLYWEHAHNDYTELFAEAGWFGVGLAAAALAFVLGSMVRTGVFSKPAKLVLLGGPLLVLLNAATDFPLWNPAVLVTAVVVVVLALRWSELERQIRRP